MFSSVTVTYKANKHTRSSLSRACCLNFSKLLADDVERVRELEVFARLDHEGTWRIVLGAES